MSRPFIKELDELLNAGIITSDTAQKVTDYYSQKKRDAPNRFPAVVNILGALLASLGIVLLIAHNWDDLSRLSKTFFALLPLVMGQALCAYTLLKQKQSIAWRESSSVILFFAVATSISLISQTYHINGTLSGFLLTWMLLTIPLVYIMPSSVTALLYIGGITWYASETGYFSYSSSHIPFYYLALLVLIIPHYYYYYKHKSESNFFRLMNWLLALSIAIVLGAFSNNSFERVEWVFTGYLALFSVYYLLGRSARFENNKLFANPFLLLGALGVLGILFFWSFDWLWNDEIGRYYMGEQRSYIYYSPFLYITAGILFLAGWLIISDYRRVKKILFDPAGFSGFFLFLLLLALRNAPQAGVLLINCWILFIAIFFIRKGALKDHLGILNFGLLIIAVLALCRFFDNDIPFIWRGLFFLATGAGFFAGNYWLVKKRKTFNEK